MSVLSTACPVVDRTPDAGVPDMLPPVHAPLPPINPCDPVWQRANYNPGPAPATPGSTREFEQKLYTGGALWVGNAVLLPPDHRAIVEVDVFSAPVDSGGSKDIAPALIDSQAWYVADIPIAATATRSAVSAYSGGETQAQVLGYCLADHSFRAGSSPPTSCGNVPVTHEVVKYDPKCVCSASDITGIMTVTQ